ncbi:5-oxoprolinase subunit C family protein [Sinosporangium siamense]|uniref:Allophanate hydrolase n=1 Tax=Sinosporangium siamense TaxID=1367973 RepID=A0A919RG38_9ACTN|nr:biotin-dependent carboxyltransferase family protein [Sinosporangium siamense]GII91754.1 allophanate hydrolase [Sinosporangium siamense]
MTPRVAEVVATGMLATVQDLGRPGLAHLGVPGAGAADRRSLRLANRLVGNPEDTAGLEATFGGLRLRFPGGAWVAVTGAPCPVGRGTYAPVWVPPDGELSLGTPSAGLRTYVAIRGGVDVEPVLGSRSHDTLSGLGPPPLKPGDLLPLGSPAGLPQPLADAAPPPPWPDTPMLRIRVGPRDDWFTPEAVAAMCAVPYSVSEDSNRVGVRLRGPVLERARRGELPSEGMVAGAVQVPPDGQPIVFLADHPPTGGYPVIGVVADADLGLAAQLRPGDQVKFLRVR